MILYLRGYLSFISKKINKRLQLIAVCLFCIWYSNIKYSGIKWIFIEIKGDAITQYYFKIRIDS